MLEGNKMCELPTKSPGLRKILRSLQKRKRDKGKYKRNESFLEAKKIVGPYVGENSYTSVTWRADKINQDNRYRNLVEKLIRLEPNDWLKFQEQLKNLQSAELQIEPRPASAYKEKTSETTKVKSPTNKQTNPTAQTQTTPPKRKSQTKLNSPRLPIHPPSSKLDNLNLNLNCDKRERSPQSKMDHAPSSTGQEQLKVSTFPNQTAETKNKFNFLERMETEGANSTRNKK